MLAVRRGTQGARPVLTAGTAMAGRSGRMWAGLDRTLKVRRPSSEADPFHIK